MITYKLRVSFRSLKEALDCFKLLHLNKGYSEKISINDFENCVHVVVGQKYSIDKFMCLIENNNLNVKEAALKTETKEVLKSVLVRDTEENENKSLEVFE